MRDDYDLDLFLETSAKTGMNAQEIFIQAAKILYKDYEIYKKERKIKEELNINNNTKLTEKVKPKKSKKCCS